MLKYRGTFRVMYEVDKRTGQATEFTYVPCNIKKGSNICRYSDDLLSVYIPSSIIVKNLLKQYSNIFSPFQIGDNEGTLLFKESDIEQIASILKIRTFGKNQNPRPKRKLNLTEEQKRVASERMKLLHKQKKLQRKP